jgi:hypothetical protein
LDPILKQSLLDDRFYNNHSFKTEAPVNGENTNAAATIIQSSFRGHTERKDISDTNENEIEEEKVIEATSVVESKESENEQQQQQEQQQPRPVEENTKEDEKLKEEAATVIQATFRGYKTRKSLVKNTPINLKADEVAENTGVVSTADENLARVESASASEAEATVVAAATEAEAEATTPSSEAQIELSTEDDKDTKQDSLILDEAATKIQATFRGFKTRQELKKDSKNEQLNQQQSNME